MLDQPHLQDKVAGYLTLTCMLYNITVSDAVRRLTPLVEDGMSFFACRKSKEMDNYWQNVNRTGANVIDSRRLDRIAQLSGFIEGLALEEKRAIASVIPALRRHFLESDRAPWYNHVNIAAHEHSGHFIPWEIPDKWVDDLPRTFRGRR